MSDAYQVLMADTQRGRPPSPASRVCVCYAVTEARGCPCVPTGPLAYSILSNYVRPVLKIADMSSFYAQAYVNLVQAAPPTAPPDTLVAKSLQNMDTFTKSISVVNYTQVNKQLGQVAGERYHYFVIILSKLIVIIGQMFGQSWSVWHQNDGY